LCEQTHVDWEWVVVLNGKNVEWRVDDDRVRCFFAESDNGVGYYKNIACEAANGNILVELDHDDLLLPNALKEIYAAFNRWPSVGFVYSDTIQIQEDGTADWSQYDPKYGWVYENHPDGQYAVTLTPHPHNVAHIWYAPNHIRAFRKSVYETAGGYNRSLKVLDDQDLMCRMYQITEFRKIETPLYKQRMHSDNTQRDPEINAHIQKTTVEIADFYLESMMLTWCKTNNLLALDLGAAHNKPEGYLGVDLQERPGVDIVADFMKLELPKSSVGLIRAHDFLEHIADRQAVIEKIYYLLDDGGMFLSMTPSTDGRGAFQDPTHISYWNENSFWYYTRAETNAYINCNVRFQASRLRTIFPTQWHEQHNISYVQANLIAIKNNERNYGGILEI
jgi:glycosyltransferase involved in cell wall biosynthesis